MLTSEIEICGVNTGACVYQTVEGIVERMKQVKIVILANAYGCYSTKTHELGLNQMKKLKRVEIKLIDHIKTYYR
jgi:nicotinamidase-related amidase